MTNPLYRLAYVLYKLFVRPFKRTPARWSAIIFDDAGRFAVEHGSAGRRLPCGRVRPGSSIPHLCRDALGLDRSCFARDGALRLIAVEGKGGEEFVFYLSGEIVGDAAQARCFQDKMSYLDKAELSSFVPERIAAKLRAGADTNAQASFWGPTGSDA